MIRIYTAFSMLHYVNNTFVVCLPGCGVVLVMSDKRFHFHRNLHPQPQSMLSASENRIDICDVISEKGPYCGRNSVFLDQLFLHFCDSIFYQNCTGSEKNVSFRYSLASNIVGPDQTPRIMRGVRSGPMIFVPP